jgi:hypothetical protein
MDSLEFIKYCNVVPYMTYTTICRNIAAHAKSCVGDGDYGTAFLLSDGRVAKIYKSWDRAYNSFLSLLGSSSNPHLPIVFEKGYFKDYSYVILEFLEPCKHQYYMRLTFQEITSGIAAVICGRELIKQLPSSIFDLAQAMKDHAKGFCLDFKQENFGMRSYTLVTLDPFTLKTKNNDHLEFVEINKPLVR